MAFLLDVGSELIEGYRLIKRLGQGGFGEVWLTSAPGGITKAIKVVYGDLDESKARQELEALQRIKEVRHPFLLSLERVEVIDGRLVVVMEYAEQSLRDRFLQCEQLGLAGIPREELLVYLHDAADALDYMLETYGLLHLDVKPPNIVLIGGRAKLADFGLVDTMANNAKKTSRAMTPAYSAPEAFRGSVSRFTDQYSLAIVFQEMLTGRRPFAGSSALQLSLQHMQRQPYLTPLSAEDKSIVGRALSKMPDRRYRTCREFVAELSRAPSYKPPPTYRTSGAVQSAPASRSRSQPLESSIFEASTASVSIDLHLRAGASEGAEDDRGAPTILRPTIFVGAGGIGGIVLRGLRLMLLERFGQEIPIFRFLLLDTDAAALNPPSNGSDADMLSAAEKLHLPLRRSEHYRPRARDLLRWIDRRWLYGIPRSLRPEGVRPLGRLAFVENCESYEQRLREIAKEMLQATARTRAQAVTGLDVHSGAARVVYVGSSSGGSSGGMAADVGFATRRILDQLGVEDAASLAFLVHVGPSNQSERETANVNTLATLIEWDHYTRAAGRPADSKGQGPPFTDCYFVTLGECLDRAQVEPALAPLIRYLYLNAVSPIGTVLNEYRERTRGKPSEDGLPASIRSFGISEISVPRYAMTSVATDLFFGYLARHWRDYQGIRNREEVQARLAEQIKNCGLEHDPLYRRVFAELERQIEKTPKEIVRAAHEKAGAGDSIPLHARGQDRFARQLAILDEALGGATDRTEPGSVQVNLDGKLRLLRGEISKKIHGWIVSQIEAPTGRLLAGELLAVELRRQLGQWLSEAESTLERYRAGRCALRVKLTDPAARAPAKGWFSSFAAKRGSEHEDLFLEYTLARLAEIAAQSTVEIYHELAKSIAALAEKVQSCRLALRPLAESVFDAPRRGSHKKSGEESTTVFKRLLVGAGAPLEEVAAEILDHVMPEALLEFDAQFQRRLEENNRGFWDLFEAGYLSDETRYETWLRIRESVLAAFAEIDVARLLLSLSPEEIDGRLTQLTENSLPQVFGPGHNPHVFVATSASSAGTELIEEVRRRLSGAGSTAVASEGDVFLVRESEVLSCDEVARATLHDVDGYREIVRRALTRIDVPWQTEILV